MTDHICAILPTYNHHQVIAGIIDRLMIMGLKVFVIDDGSAGPARQALAEITARRTSVELHRLSANRGKGAAMAVGFKLAFEQGYTHALQIDADGQHDIDQVPNMLAQVAAHPDALISGVPVFDQSAPFNRRIGHWITTFWVWIETGSFSISDAMCGFRIYPLQPVCDLLDEVDIGSRMDFDIDIIVRLYWRRVPIIEMPVRVIYPMHNTSNFHVFYDNLRISATHTGLVFGMIRQVVGNLMPPKKNTSPPFHWAKLNERGSYWGISSLAFIYRHLGRQISLAIATIPIFFFYVTGYQQRQASHIFLARAYAMRRQMNRPGRMASFRHFMSFGGKMLDALGAWIGTLPVESVISDNPDRAAEIHGDPRGAILIVSHVGNNDVSRLRLALERRRMTILVHTHHAQNYAAFFSHIAPQTNVEIMQVTDIGPEAAIILETRIAAGDWIAISGDRTPVKSLQHTTGVPFLGSTALFPKGPYLLAHLLKCPVYLMFCLREGNHHKIYLEQFAEQIILPRKSRDSAITEYARRYAERLETYALKDPFQWYNFFDFWADSNEPN